MIRGIIVVAALAITPAFSSASAQGAAKKQVEISPALLKSMTSQKSRSKKSMMERAGLKRAASAPGAAAVRPAKPATPPAPTSVRALDPFIDR